MKIFGIFINTRKLRINPIYRHLVWFVIATVFVAGILTIAVIIYLLWHYQDSWTQIVNLKLKEVI